jgi:3'-phosphoadenosine 5'-phosphosulfate (PAPS) 3'-phosphatase
MLPLEKLQKCAEIAARAAGDFIGEYNRDQLTVIQKSGGVSEASQVVTEVDIEAQGIILSYLNESIEEYDLGLLTEELVDDKSRFEKEAFWCIDPLDGTLSFIEDSGGYAVSIALVSKSGEALVGVVYNPVTDKLYSAFKGGGVTVDGVPLKLKEKGDSVNLFCDRSFLKHDRFGEITDKINSFADKFGYKEVKLHSHGGAVMNALWCLENSPAIYFKLPKPQKGGGSIWDFAATSSIFNEIDGVVATDMFGENLELNKSGGTFMNELGAVFSSDADLSQFVYGLI